MSRGTVLVVDDDPMIIDLLRDILEWSDYRVEVTAGAVTPAVARDVQPDLILLDMHMPGMDGAEVSRRLRADPATAGIPVVALSAAHNPEAAAAAMAADDYVAKPFDLRELLVHVEKWAGRRHGSPLAGRPSAVGGELAAGR